MAVEDVYLALSDLHDSCFKPLPSGRAEPSSNTFGVFGAIRPFLMRTTGSQFDLQKTLFPKQYTEVDRWSEFHYEHMDFPAALKKPSV